MKLFLTNYPENGNPNSRKWDRQGVTSVEKKQSEERTSLIPNNL
jgi:hypothetical protein